MLFIWIDKFRALNYEAFPGRKQVIMDDFWSINFKEVIIIPNF